MKLVLSSDWMTTFLFSFGVIVWRIITLILSSSWMITCSFSFGFIIWLYDTIRCHYQAGRKYRSAAVGQSRLEWSFQQGYSLFWSFDFRENVHKNYGENCHYICQFSWANFHDNVKMTIIVSILSFSTFLERPILWMFKPLAWGYLFDSYLIYCKKVAPMTNKKQPFVVGAVSHSWRTSKLN